MKKLPTIAEDLIITGSAFLLFWLLTALPMQLKFLDPIGKSLSDFELQDIIFSKLREEQPADTAIVLVNIGYMSRAELAQLFRNVAAGRPAVTGADMFFLREKEAATDSALADAMQLVPNLVMVSKLTGYNPVTGTYGGFTTSLPVFRGNAQTAYANLPSDDDASFRTIRYFRPYVTAGGKQTPSFAAAITAAYNPAAEAYLRGRGVALELLNYRGNTDKFITVEGTDVANGRIATELFTGKIVLLGFMGSTLATPVLEDIFFTPVNERFAGKTFPDMYGIVIHANIISMLLSRSYVTPVPQWLSVLLAVIICVLMIRLQRFLRREFPKYTSEVFKLAVLFFSILNLAVTLLAFSYLQLKLSLSLALVLVALLPGRIDFYDNFVRRRLTRGAPQSGGQP